MVFRVVSVNQHQSIKDVYSQVLMMMELSKIYQSGVFGVKSAAVVLLS